MNIVTNETKEQEVNLNSIKPGECVYTSSKPETVYMKTVDGYLWVNLGDGQTRCTYELQPHSWARADVSVVYNG